MGCTHSQDEFITTFWDNYKSGKRILNRIIGVPDA